ncbi:MAG: glycosyltransferase family 39 protein [Myxococcota bacterium]
MRAALLALVALAVLRLALAGTTGLVDDEAYYWAWSRRLAAGYFDHPPAIAWLIACSERLLGANSLGVRAGPVIAATLATAALVPAAKDRALLLLALASLPLFALGGVLATPDLPLMAGWSLALGGAATGNWLLAGLGAGIAGLGKYTGWGLWPLLFLAAPREWRRMLPGLAITALCLAPNLVWNARHDWVSVRFQLDHGLGARAPAVGEFLAAQVGLVGPVFFGAVAAWWAVGWKGDRVDRICWWTSLPVFVFFAIAAARTHGEPNWPAPAWLGAAVGVARAGGRIARAGWVGAGLNVALSALLVAHVHRPLLAIPNDPVARLGLGDTLAQSVEAWGVEPVYTERYQEAALIAYHAGIDAHALPGVARPDQYDLWPAPVAERALFVRPWRGGDTTSVDPFCATRGPANVVTERADDGTALARWQVYEVSACRIP